MIFELRMFIAGFKCSPSFLCPKIMKRTPDTLCIIHVSAVRIQQAISILKASS